MIYGFICIFILVDFLLGYAIGRRNGIKEGFDKGLAYAPLKLREEVYQKYRCPICNNQIDS